MADQPLSVYYALDGPDLDGLVGSARIATHFCSCWSVINREGVRRSFPPSDIPDLNQTLPTTRHILEAH